MQRILFKKIVPIDYFKVKVNQKSTRKIIPELEERVKNHWNKYVLDMENKGLEVWNGKLYRLENLDNLLNGSKEIIISPGFDFAHSRIIKSSDLKGFSSDYHNSNIATIGVVETSDGYTIWEFKNITSNSENITPLGGALQPEEVKVTEFSDFYRNFTKEVYEESYIKEDELIECNLYAILRKSLGGTILFCYYTKTSLNSVKVAKRLEKALEKGESDDLRLVRNADLVTFRANLEEDSIIGVMIDLYMKSENWG